MSTARFSSGEPTAPLWQVLYQDAILEFDNAKLPKRILRARSAIANGRKKISPIRPSAKFSMMRSSPCTCLRK
ncbi:MAG: hypothetical protein ABSF85_17625 [Terriglobales bacterium]|jgi:hypothetical protein